MKLLLKQTQSVIHKSLAVIRKGLVFGEILGNKVLLGTHHKTGTVWMLKIFTSIGSYYALKFRHNGANQSLGYPARNFDIFLQNHFGLIDNQNIANTIDVSSQSFHLFI